MNKIDFETDSYRNWLKGWIKSKGMTQARFVQKHPNAVSSYSVLMSILNGKRNPNLGSFFKLLSPMKLRDEELLFLLLLKLENELDFYDKDGREVKAFLNRAKNKITPFLRGDFDNEVSLNPMTSTVLEAYQMLSAKHKERLETALVEELEIQAGRQRQSRGIHTTLRKLESLLKK